MKKYLILLLITLFAMLGCSGGGGGSDDPFTVELTLIRNIDLLEINEYSLDISTSDSDIIKVKIDSDLVDFDEIPVDDGKGTISKIKVSETVEELTFIALGAGNNEISTLIVTLP